MASFRIRLLQEARDDLCRLEDFLIDRQLTSQSPDWTLPERSLDAIREGMRFLAWSPFSCRKARLSRAGLRELVIPLNETDYIALFNVLGDEVFVVAVRHLLAQDHRH